MRILFLSEFYWPYLGGAEIFASQLIESLGERGFQFCVATSHGNLELPDRDTYQDVPIHRLPFRDVLASGELEPLVMTQRAFEKLKRDYQPDAVFLNGIGTLSWFHLRANKPVKSPLFLRINQRIAADNGQVSSLSTTMIEAADSICCVSDALRGDVLRLAPDVASKVHTVRNGLQAPELTPQLPPADSARVLCLGRLVDVKGFDLAIRAIHALRSRLPRLRLMIAGEGPEEPALREQAEQLGIADRVEFIGGIPPKEVPALINRSTLVLMPSRSEGFPAVALQAGIMARPVVATSVGGLAEAVLPNETGLLVPREDCDALAEAIAHLVEHPTVASEMGRASRRRIQTEFAWDVCVDEYDRMLRRLFENRT